MALNYDDDITLDVAKERLEADPQDWSRVYDYVGTLAEYHQDGMISDDTFMTYLALLANSYLTK